MTDVFTFLNAGLNDLKQIITVYPLRLGLKSFLPALALGINRLARRGAETCARSPCFYVFKRRSEGFKTNHHLMRLGLKSFLPALALGLNLRRGG